MEKIIEFAKWAIREGVFTGAALDGWEIQEKAVELGLLRSALYDPALHGDVDDADPGMEIFVFTEMLAGEKP